MAARKQYPALLQEFICPGLLKVTLSRPDHRNSASLQLITSVTNFLTEVSTDDSVRCIILTGDPRGKAFSAGADLSMFPDSQSGHRTFPTSAEYRDPGGYTSLAAMRCCKPIICAINGAAVGWGLAVTLACDVRVVSETAKVGFPMAARGMPNESISSWLLPRLVGAGLAKELVFTARIFKAAEARKFAPMLFNHIVPEGQVLAKAEAIGREIVHNSSPTAVTLAKYLMNEGMVTTPEQAMLDESRALHHVTFAKNDDLKEGIQAFLQKRQPQWKLTKAEDLPTFLPFSQRINVFSEKLKLPPVSKHSKL